MRGFSMRRFALTLGAAFVLGLAFSPLARVGFGFISNFGFILILVFFLSQSWFQARSAQQDVPAREAQEAQDGQVQRCPLCEDEAQRATARVGWGRRGER
jgi:hypothetical protein